MDATKPKIKMVSRRLPEALLRACKIRAAELGMSLDYFFAEALALYLEKTKDAKG